MMPTQKEIAECYQPLFDYMHDQYGLLLLVSEMDEIISAVNKTTDNLNELFTDRCDIKGCNPPVTSQGVAWQEKGYWCVCSQHTDMARKNVLMPQMKQKAIDRENSRDEQGFLPQE